MAAEFSVLGDIEARLDGVRLDLGHSRQRCVLVALLVDANQPVPVDRLVDRVWDRYPPHRAQGTLYSYLSRLRQILAPVDDVAIRRHPGGYVLAVDPMAVDLHRFQHLVGRARAAADPAEAQALFRRALGLWRGAAFAELDTPWLNGVREVLEVTRLAAELDHNDLVLERGGHAELLPRLSSRAAAHPLDERLAGQLMLALYRSGRQADALDHYRRVRALLADELGTDPGPQLQRLHQQILTADDAVAGPDRAGGASLRQRSQVPRQLPASLPSFTGREAELAELSAVLAHASDHRAPAAIATICGTGGMGKTCLAVRWANDNADRYPDGQLYANLRGFDPSGDPVPPTAVLRRFLEALGVPPATIPADTDARAGLYRSLIADRRMLILLDNARDTDQVLPLLPGTSTSAVLVTSRHQLAGLVTTHGARRLSLDVLPATMARRLLVSQLGAHRAAAEPEATDSLLQHCAGLPLALSIVGARAAAQPDFPLAALADELEAATTRLDALNAGELTVNLRAVLACSYEALSREAATVFGLLGLAPGPDIGLAAAASMVALPTPRVRTLLRELTNAHVLHEPAPGRYRMHDLVRLYATERAHALTTPAARRAALHRILDHYLHTAYAADRLLNPHRDPIVLDPRIAGVRPERLADHAQALAWFTTEHAPLVAAVGRAAEAGFDTHAWSLAWALLSYCEQRGFWHDQIGVQPAALAAARRLGDRRAQAHAHRDLARAHIWFERYDDAHTHLREALDLFAALGDTTGQALTYRSLARVSARQGRHAEALPHDRQALALFRAAGHRHGEAVALNAVGWHLAHIGRFEEALDLCQQALRLHRELGDRRGMALTWGSLGYAYRHLGNHDRAIACYRQALTAIREVRARCSEAEMLTSLGDTYRSAGRHEGARDAWRRALAILSQIGHPDTEQVRARLAAAPRPPAHPGRDRPLVAM